jgi:beta-lactamase class A
MVRRRAFESLVVTTALTLSVWAADPATASPEKRLSMLEAESGGRLGVVALDTATGRRLAHRADERFAMCSTFKLCLAAAVLARVDAGKESLDRQISYSAADLLDYSPVTRAHLKQHTLSVEALCKAAVEESDNAAANLLLKGVGGPDGFTSYLRSLGDTVTRLDRNEPELNSNEPGDPRDTTTPAAMVETMRRLLLGDALSAPSRATLIGWMVACKTGTARIRGGVPGDWRVGDKTGTGVRGATNDIAILWPPGRPPILVAAYSSDSKKGNAECSALLAEVGTLVAQEFAGSKAGPVAGGK